VSALELSFAVKAEYFRIDIKVKHCVSLLH